jgi:hypothetical protein
VLDRYGSKALRPRATSIAATGMLITGMAALPIVHDDGLAIARSF